MTNALIGGLPLGDHVSWDDNGDLLVNSPELVARIRRPHMSASTASSITRCGAGFVADRALSTSGFNLLGAAEIGTAAHTVMERLMQLPPVRRTETNAAKLLYEIAHEAPQSDLDPDYAKVIGGDPVLYTQWSSSVASAYGGIFAIEDPRDIDVVATEMCIEDIELGGVPIKGFIDRVDRVEFRGEKTMRIVDYKTGKPKLKKPPAHFDDATGRQIKTYVEAYEAITGERPKLGALYYTAPGGGVRRVAVSRKETRSAVVELAHAWDVYNRAVSTGTFTATPGPLCGWCPLVNACPSAHNRGLYDRKGDAPTPVELGMPDPAQPPTDAPALHEVGSPSTNSIDTSSEQTPSESDGDMADNTTKHVWAEAKPFDGLVIPDQRGDYVNLNSYGARTLFGLTAMAIELLESRKDATVRASEVTALTHTLVAIAQKAQKRVTGTSDMNAGAFTRVVGALHSAADMTPPPFGGTNAQWKQWANKTVSRIESMVSVVNDIAVNGPTHDEPWGVLATDYVEPTREEPPVEAWDEPVGASH